METPGRINPRNQQISSSSLKSTLRAYSVPLILFILSLFYQLLILPRSFPPSHYDVLGIPKYSSIEEVAEAYERITSKWDSGVEVPQTIELIKVQYAFELLTNQLLKRDYDIYNIDETFNVIDNLNTLHKGKNSNIELPIIKTSSFEPADHDFGVVTSENFSSVFEDDKALLLQIISHGSNRCMQFSADWKRIVSLLDGVANTGVVELGDVQLAVYLAEKKSSGQPFFRRGLPAIVAFPPGCRSLSCLLRYEGFDFSVDAITDWFATSILNAPRILYYNMDAMVNNFLAKSKPHKVKVIFFSKTGERATPFIRQAARRYWQYASFAFTLWKEEESSFWWNTFGVESAPAIVFLKDPGVEPVVFHGKYRFINSSIFVDIMEKNKLHVLPQLRNITAMELGCDSRGYSRAGNDTKIWYCAIVAGRLSQELNKMRKTMRRVQETLTNDGEMDVVDQDSVSAPAATALKQKRLAFAWLDGEAQQKYCFFHIHSESSYDTCGPRRDITDVAQLFLVRYERDDSEEKIETNKQATNVFQAWHQTEVDPVSTLVAKYNGSLEILEIIKWISETIKDGDTRKIPPFKSKTPELSAEEVDNTWSKGSQKFVSSGKGMKQWTSSFISRVYDYLADPRIGPSLLLGALMSFGLIWLKRSRPAQPIHPHESNPTKVEDRSIGRNRARNNSNQLIPPSITDEEPSDAQQITLSDSDSE
ncbi:hypothetical protein F511_16128 [Dorcoceras hygrometricum]|uniref:J domain-containing protein n=1 Tax=Dorcoceras hygrometricum TaxID=472368 RepID=A0A2Z7D9G9_9LAMI|nr:hypothetical protein F511_16128 [Dorcoceras hygrometricum]